MKQLTQSRFPIAFQAVFALIVLAVAWQIPESPRYLLAKDRIEEARTALARFEGEEETSELVAARMQVVSNAIALERKGHSNNPFAKTDNKHLYRTLIAIATNILAQMSGINLITFYSNTTLEGNLGYSPILSRIISSCMQTWQFMCATSAVLLIDRFGRRKLFMTCAFLMAGTFFLTSSSSREIGLIYLHSRQCRHSRPDGPQRQQPHHRRLQPHLLLPCPGRLPRRLITDPFHVCLRDCASQGALANHCDVGRCELAVQLPDCEGDASCVCQYWVEVSSTKPSPSQAKDSVISSSGLLVLLSRCHSSKFQRNTYACEVCTLSS